MYPYSDRKKSAIDKNKQLNSEELRIPKQKPHRHELPYRQLPYHEPPHHEPPRHEPPHQSGKPPLEPPAVIPQRSNLPGIEPYTIVNCLYKTTYIWLKNGREFWLYPVYTGRTSMAGFRWSGNGWAYYGFDIYSIEAFTCGA